MYKSYVYLKPEGTINVGEYKTKCEALESAICAAEYINGHTESKAEPAVEEIGPEWIMQTKSGRYWWKCSECGDIVYAAPTNYCANCGAKMIK